MVLNGIVISDIHTGAPRIAPGVITENIRKNVFPEINSDTDIVLNLGDYYDGPLDTSSEHSLDAIELIRDIADLSLQNDFFYRGLQGTYTHDRRQNQFFVSANKYTPKLHGIDRIKFFDVLDIEHIDPLNINILYKPDSLPYNDAYIRMVELIKNTGVDIDIFCNHGYFEHLLPRGIPHMPSNTLDAKLVSELIKGITFNGHIHTPSIYRKIVNVGSHERLKHGEEEDKGFFKFTYDTETGISTQDFKKNENATKFTTIDLTRYDHDLDQCKAIAAKIVSGVLAIPVTSPDTFIRLISKHSDITQAVGVAITNKFPSVVISTDTGCGKKDITEIALSDEPVEELPEITPSNLIDMITLHARDLGSDISSDVVEAYLKGNPKYDKISRS